MKNRLSAAIALSCVVGLAGAGAADGPPPALVTAPVESSSAAATASFDAVVEAVRQTVVASQVAGAVTRIHVRAGDAVRAGQPLVGIDARAADQNAAASDAQVQAARAALEVATQEYERQKQLFQKNYISQAAYERAQAQFKATQAQVNAQLAQAEAARTQSGFFQVKAPYAGIVAEVPVSVGDMAMPGRALLSLYDPTAMRVTAMIPQSAIPAAGAVPAVRIEIPGVAAPAGGLRPARVQVLPSADPATHTVELRLDLPAGAKVFPGLFARAILPVAGTSAGGAGGAGAKRLFVPAVAVVRRAEMTGLYVIDANGRPQLRQVRVGPRFDDKIEILSGVDAGERVALEPQAAARMR
jgi:multidrug efflux system membrane fusion protein